MLTLDQLEELYQASCDAQIRADAAVGQPWQAMAWTQAEEAVARYNAAERANVRVVPMVKQ